jgi:DNA (cytosine-5)-methyltransferase 1
MLKVLDLFSGIGGFSLGLERTGGFETVAFCEIEDYPRRVLAKHWPNVPIYEDVKELTYERLEADGLGGIDIIVGGYPCQPFSHAGKRQRRGR